MNSEEFCVDHEPWFPARDPGAVQWTTPPSCQGQIVQQSYALDENGMIFMRVHDHCDGSTTYQSRPLRDGEEFEPWQTEPE